MDLEAFFEKSWNDYIKVTPSAKKIVDLLENEGEVIKNDHIALRTFSHPKVHLDLFSEYFISQGYLKKDRYLFPDKKLTAFHFEHKVNPELPKIFVSELDLDSFDENYQALINRLMGKIPEKATFVELYELGKPWAGDLTYKEYEFLKNESEYAAWLAGMGFRVNHFTVSLNHLNKYNTVQKINALLRDNGFPLNEVGGAIKGSPDSFLEQSSTMADRLEIRFSDGPFEVSTCYYEFALRYRLKDGKYFQGFVAQSAGKIFESTDLKD